MRPPPPPLLLGVALCALLSWLPRAAHAIEITDFLATNMLPDGEIETRIRYRGVTAKETAVQKGYRKGLKYRQLTDGKHFIQLIYDADEVLRDCEYQHDRHAITKFLKTFRTELRDLQAMSNLTVTSLDPDAPNPAGLNPREHGWFHYDRLRDQCRRRHRELKLMLRMDQQRNTSLAKSERSTRAKRSFLILPGTIWCGLSDASFHYTDLGGMEATDKCCRIHDHCKNNILPFQKKFNYYNTGPFTISHCFCDARLKRDLSDLLRVPETKWCGKGYSATKYTHLGGLSPTDKCCRVHDMSCPFWIGGFETKYGLSNWRVNTLMHCGCDERFRACLKMVGTSDANVVGKIFFNIVQTKCFVIKKKPVCRERNWSGKCVKKKNVKQAILRPNPHYK